MIVKWTTSWFLCLNKSVCSTILKAGLLQENRKQSGLKWLGMALTLKVVKFTYKENYVLAIFKTKETYDNLKGSLSDVTTKMAHSNEIQVENVKYKIEYFLGSDWKILACIDDVTKTLSLTITTFARFKCVVQKSGIPLAFWHRRPVNLLVGKLWVYSDERAEYLRIYWVQTNE